jgi:hypothetical protein
MSVVAAAALVDRVLICADCRVTVAVGGRQIHFDHTLKLFRCGPWTVIGFVGNDVATASVILRELLRQQAVRPIPDRREHPSRLHLWLPKFLRRIYARMSRKEALTFLVASVLPGFRSAVSSRRAAEIIGASRKEGRPAPQWALAVVFAAQRAGLQDANVPIGNTYAPRLMVLKAPRFSPSWIGGPLSFAAVGTGGEVSLTAAKGHLLHLFTAKHPMFARLAFEKVVAGACVKAGISTVGGLYPTYELGTNGVVGVQGSSPKTSGGPDEGRIELEFVNAGRWVQHERAKGISIPIVPPWETLADVIAEASGPTPTGLEFGASFEGW